MTVALSVLTLATLAVTPAAAHVPDGRVLDRRAAPDLHPGATVTDHGITMTVPPRGGFVWGELKFKDGSWQELGIETSLTGRVFLSGSGNERAALARARSAGDPRGTGVAPIALDGGATVAATRVKGECADTFRNLYWWRTPDLEWQFNPAGTPAYLRDEDGGTLRVQNAIARAQRNITTSRNRCERADRVGAKGQLLGTTNRRPNVSSGGSCPGGDGRSVIKFGDLPSYSIAFTCVYGVRRGRASESDILINGVDTRWALSRSSCSGSALLLEAGMTHEFGHSYGLAHASYYRNPWLTMQPLVRACSKGHSTLGLGDMLGLEKKY